MPPLALAVALVQYGPTILPMIQELLAMARDKRDTVTPEDIALIIKLGNKSSADYLAAAGGAPKSP